jgi:hypothetical protein
MDEKEAPKRKTGSSIFSYILNYISKYPWMGAIGILGSIASIIGIPLTLILDQPLSPELTYYIDPLRQTIVKSGETSGLTVLFKGEKVTKSITTAQFKFWNAGTLPIRREDILSRLSIKIEGETPILQAEWLKRQKPDKKGNHNTHDKAMENNEYDRIDERDKVIKLELNRTNMEKGELNIGWKILEEGDGGILQLTYKGDRNLKIFVKGVIQGQPQVERFDDKILYKALKSGPVLIIISLFVGLLYYCTYRSYDYLTNRISFLLKFNNVYGNEKFVRISMFILGEVIIISYLLFGRPYSPPF